MKFQFILLLVLGTILLAGCTPQSREFIYSKVSSSSGGGPDTVIEIDYCDGCDTIYDPAICYDNCTYIIEVI